MEGFGKYLSYGLGAAWLSGSLLLLAPWLSGSGEGEGGEGIHTHARTHTCSQTHTHRHRHTISHTCTHTLFCDIEVSFLIEVIIKCAVIRNGTRKK